MVRNSRLAIGACLIAVSTLVMHAQDKPLKPVAANGSVRFTKLSTVMDSKILIQDDQAAGKVVDVVLSDSGCIDYLVASYDEQYYVVPYSAVSFRGPDRLVYIDIAPAQFRQVEFFSGDRWPDFYATTYQRNVFNVFGVTNFRNDGPRTSLKPDQDRDRNDRDRDRNDRDRNRDRDRNDRDRDRDRDQDADRPNENRKPGVKAPDRGEDRPESKPRTTTPPDRIKGDTAPESRDKNAPITKPNPPVVDPPAKPDLKNPPKPATPKVEIPKGDAPKPDPLKPANPPAVQNPK